MSLGAVLDVIIGLVFTYLLLGMIASGVQEAWAAMINKRGKELRDGIAELLKGSGPLDLSDKVFCHSLVFGLSPGKRIPSYVPARNFGLALIETLRAGTQGPVFSEVERRVASLPPGDVKQSLTAFMTEAKGDLDALRKSIETWFDDAMDRVSGVYKRYTQIFTAVFGLAAAIAFNVDSIKSRLHPVDQWASAPSCRYGGPAVRAEQSPSGCRKGPRGKRTEPQANDQSLESAAGGLGRDSGREATVGGHARDAEGRGAPCPEHHG